MSSNLRIEWATYEAAKYAVEHWHYSRTMPAAALVKFAIYEGDRFIGAILFGKGATADLVKSYGLKKTEGCELVRVALRRHKTEVSRMIAICLRMLKREFPGLRLVVSFADQGQEHHGGIYQAGNWIYTGQSTAADEYRVNGKQMHGRSFRSLYPGMEQHPGVVTVKGTRKHRYLMPLDKQMREAIEPLREKPPKRGKQAMAGPPAQRQGSADRHAPFNEAANGP